MNRLDRTIYELAEKLVEAESKENTEEIVLSKEDVKNIIDILHDVKNCIKSITDSGF